MENDSQVPLSVRQVHLGLEVPLDPAGAKKKKKCFINRKKVTHTSPKAEETLELDSFILAAEQNTQVNVNLPFIVTRTIEVLGNAVSQSPSAKQCV